MLSVSQGRRPRATAWIRVLCAAALVAAALATVPVLAYEDQIRNESRYLAGQIAERGKTAVAVIDFTDLDGAVTHLGRFLAEEMSVALSTEARSFRVVDRNHIRSLLKEHKLASSGLIDPDTARELGRIAGVDSLVTATVTPLGDSVRLSIKVLDSETAQVIASSSCNVPKTQAIDSLLRRGVASSGGGGLSSSTAAASSPSTPTVEKLGCTFVLQGCQRSGETVTCYLVVTNQNRDRGANLDRRETRVFDHYGRELYASLVYLGSRSTNSFSVSASLVRGIPMSAGAQFEGISSDVTRLTLVEFGFDNEPIQFKDVPIS